MNISSAKITYCMTLSVYLAAGITVFTPYFEKTDVTITLLCAFLSAAVLISVSTLLLKHVKISQKSGYTKIKILSSFAVFLTVLCVLLLMTEVIASTCFIVGKGVSKQYYLLFSLALLFAALYLCRGGSMGIYRFCTLGILPLAIFAICLILPFFTSYGIMTDFVQLSHPIKDSILCGIKCGIFLASDIALFLYCFEDTSKKFGKLLSLNLLSLVFAFIYLCICAICVYLLFGKVLTQGLSYPFFAHAKAFSGFDTTETVSFVGIFAFITKSSVYILCCAKALKRAFPLCQKLKDGTVCAILFLFIPAIYLPFLFSPYTSRYGKYQFLIYPVLALLWVVFTLTGIAEKKHKP